MSVSSQINSAYFQELSINGFPFYEGVNVIYKDTMGFLWVGTENGLYKYDGNNITHYQYDVFDENSLPNNSVNSIVEDEFNNLWIGCASYLVHFNRKLNNFKGYYKDITTNVLNVTSTGVVWANLKKTGLTKIIPQKNSNDSQFDTKFNFDKSSILLGSNKIVNSLIEDDFGRIWIGASKGLVALNSKNKFVKTNFKSNIKYLKAIDNNRIVALSNSELFILQYTKDSFNIEILETYSNLIDGPYILQSISVKRNLDEFWIGTNNGLIKATRKNDTFEFVKFSSEGRKGSLLSNNINSIVSDSFGNLWIGTIKGINKNISRSSIFEFHNINKTGEIETFDTNKLFYSASGELFVGMKNGLFLFDNKLNDFKKVKTNVNVVTQIFSNSTYNKLLISNNRKLYKANDSILTNNSLKFTFIKEFDGEIIDFIVTDENDIWVGLWNQGLKIATNDSISSSFKKHIISRLSNKHISSLLKTKTNFWIGTRGAGLFKVDFIHKTIEEYLPSNVSGLGSNAILCLYEDSSNNIWIGTRGGGLYLYQKSVNKFKKYGKSDGFESNTISAIQEDQFKNIWMSTTTGITKLEIKSGEVINFGIEDGINSNHFIYNSSTSNNDRSILYFGCSDGFYSVSPKKFSKRNIIPTTVITSFSTLETNEKNSTSIRKNLIYENTDLPITLPYNKNDIVFEFSSLDLTSPNKNKYAYKLEGLDDYWIYTNSFNKNVNYNNLPSGEYTFNVKSSNSDGIWNETPAKLSFLITPPFWASSLAIFIYVILGILMITISYLIIKKWYFLKQNLVRETIDREKESQLNKMKMVFFTDISHELRTPLTLVLGTIEKVIKDKNFTLSPLSSQRIYNNSLRMKRLINQVMDFRKFDVGKFKISVSEETIIHDIKKIKNAFNDFSKISNVKFTLNAKKNDIKAWYDLEILEKILFNLLSNAFKYTNSNGEIKVNAKIVSHKKIDFNKLPLKKGNYLMCSVYDNGLGIPKKDIEYIFDRYYQSTKLKTNQIPGTGIGMELVHKLIDKHKGEIIVTSEENVFTEFKFYLPLDKAHYSDNEIILDRKSVFEDMTEYHINEEIIPEYEPLTSIKDHSKPSILLVEDNIELRTMIKESLSSDFLIFEASNGKDGYDQVVDKKPNLIISDIRMPLENGVSMLKRIKLNTEINHIPIFMLTAKDQIDIKLECISLGADDYIEKPFSLQYLIYKVKNALVTRKYLKEKYSKVITAEPSEIEVVSNDEKFIKKLIRIIEDSIDDNLLSVEYLASEVGMSRTNLYRKLQVIINDTPVNFIKKIRLKRAKQLLKKDSLYLSEIAIMTGFSNQKYFSRCFSKEFGISPSEYIKKNINK